MVLIGEEYVRRELEFIPATCKVIEYYSQSYGCPSCKEGLTTIQKTCNHKVSGAGCSGRKSPASASTVTWIMYQKYAKRLHTGRRKIGKQYGAQISRTTLANWNRLLFTELFFQPMYDHFHCELLKRSFAMADETRVQVLNEKGVPSPDPILHVARSEAARTGFPAIILVWLLRPGAFSHAKEFLEGTTISGNRWISGIQPSSGDQPLLLVGRTSVATLSMPYLKENSMTTASRQCRESSTATGYSPLGTPLTKKYPGD